MNKEKDLLEMYKMMLMTRRFSEKLLQLCAEGRSFEGLHSSIGEEAVGVGASYGLREDDFIIPTLRTREVFMVRGMSLKQQMAAAFGKVDGPARGKTDGHHSGDLDKGIVWGTGIIGAQFTVGAGIALVNKLKNNDNIVICFFGDGASFEGEFHEALSFASSKNLPIIFVCNNNQYAASMPFSKASKVQDIADHAIGYGIPGEVVDGMDVLEVYSSVQKAVTRARRGEGPSIIECKSYRYLVHYSRGKQGLVSGHTEFRSLEEIKKWKEIDPIIRTKKILFDKGLLTERENDKIENKIKNMLDDAIEFAESSSFPECSEVLEDVFG